MLYCPRLEVNHFIADAGGIAFIVAIIAIIATIVVASHIVNQSPRKVQVVIVVNHREDTVGGNVPFLPAPHQPSLLLVHPASPPSPVVVAARGIRAAHEQRAASTNPK